jgi:hypothetical protein
VLRRGPARYHRGYVDTLRSMCARHLGTHRFVCLTDDPVDQDDVPLVQAGWKEWWSKVELFRPDVLPTDEPVVYIDLDTIITGPIDWMVPAAAGFWMWLVPRREPILSSCFMAWWGDFGWLYEDFAREPERLMLEYGAHPRKSDEAYIREALWREGIEIGDLGEQGKIARYPGKDASLVHASPSWIEEADDFIREHWR